MNRSRLLLATFTLLAGCVAPVSEENRPCPCAAGWVCCEGVQICATSADLCPGGDGGGAPPACSCGNGEKCCTGHDGCFSETTNCELLPTCTDECSLYSKTCDLDAVKTCEKGADGCTHWSTASVACAADEFCSLGQCHCDAATCVFIASISPIGPYTEGQEIRIAGRAFNYSTGTARVYFDNGIPATIKAGSNDSLLVVTIPSLTIPGGGRFVKVDVENGNGSRDAQLIWVTPDNFSLQGNIGVEWLGTTPATLTAGGPADFRFRLHSRANQTGSYFIQASATPYSWSSRLQVPSTGISVAPNADADFLVRLSSVPQVLDGTPFQLVVDAGAGGVMGTSGLLHFQVGQTVVQPPTTFGLVWASTIPASGTGASVLRAASGSYAGVTLVGEFAVPGTFSLSTSVKAGNGWGAALVNDTPSAVVVISSEVPNGGVATKLIHVNAWPVDSSASATGEVEVVLTDANGGRRDMSFALELAKSSPP